MAAIEDSKIVIYKDGHHADGSIEVNMQDETVWLNRNQLADLFGRDIKTMG